MEILDKIIDTYTEENVDPKFWKYIFKYYPGGGSGVNPSMDGWIINFIPYIDDKPSPFAKRTLSKTFQECDEGDKADLGEDSDDSMLEADLS